MNDLAASWLMHIGLPAVVSHSDGEPGAQQFAPYSALQALQAYPGDIEAQRDYFAHGLALLSAWADQHDPMPWHFNLAGDVIGREGLQPGIGADDARRELAADMLASARVYAEEVRRRLKARPDLADQPVQPAKGSPIAWWDAALAKVLERIQGARPALIKAAQADLDSGAKKAWSEGATACLERRWLEVGNRERWYGLRPMWRLALLTWQWHTQPRLLNRYPALAFSVAEAKGKLQSRGHEQRVVDAQDGLELCAGHEILARAQVSSLPADMLTDLLDLLRRGAADLQTVTAHRLIVYLVRTCQWRDARGETSPTVLEFHGGYKELAERIGCTSRQDQALLPRILKAGQYWSLQRGEVHHGGLWTYTDDPGAATVKRRGRPAYVQIRLGEPLAPLYALRQGLMHEPLVPVVPLPSVLEGSTPQTHAAQLTLSQAIVAELVAQRQNVAARGGAVLDASRIAALAASVGLREDTAKACLEQWADGTFLEAVAPGVYHLADSGDYGMARAFVDEGAKRAAKGRAAGKASARTRSRRVGTKTH
jgi:hypothetical protein